MRKALAFFLLFLSGCSYLERYIEPSEKTWTVGILVYEGVYNTEFAAPMDVFHRVNTESSAPVEIFLIGPSARTVTSAEGLRFKPDRSFTNHPGIDILVIPGSPEETPEAGTRSNIVEWIQDVSEDARYVLSNGRGAFLLAEAELLEERTVVSRPGDVDRLREQFPGLRPTKDVAFARDGKWVTGAGGVTSYDSALYIVQEIWGAKTAAETAAKLLKTWDLNTVRHRIVRQ